MSDEDILAGIKDFAARAHGTQTRRYTLDLYIVHPVRVMELCAGFTTDMPILAAALLHDVLEDTPVNEEELHTYLKSLMDAQTARKTLELVIDLTDVYTKDNYPELNRRERKNREVERMSRTAPGAQTVKYADIIDNSIEIVQHDRSFAGVFLHECRRVLQVMPSGNPELYTRAKETVNTSLRLLNS